ncbi:MAG: hypothetical protein V3Q69_09360 [Burkholderia sp.]
MASMGIISGDTNGWRTSLVRHPFVSPEIMPIDAMASSYSIYATTPIEVATRIENRIFRERTLLSLRERWYKPF